MENFEQDIQLLELIQRPAFCMEGGAVIFANQAAQQRQVAPGMTMQDFFPEEAPCLPPENGCAYLTVQLGGIPCSATATELGGRLVFILEEAQNDHLQALALASQQLRIPLANVMTLTDILLSGDAMQADPKVQQQVSQINRGLFQLLRIISNMSDAHRYSLEPAAKMATVNITRLLDEVMEKSRDLVIQTGHTLKFQDLQQNIYTLADREMLERAVYNLISNAVKFSPKGSTVEASLTQQGSTLYFTVRNEGDGIPGSIRGSIFSRYLRSPSIEDGRYGLGLGLVLVRTAATAHGGTVLMEQPEGKGVKITMAIPIRQRGNPVMRSDILTVDYAGERDHGLMEFSDSLPSDAF